MECLMPLNEQEYLLTCLGEEGVEVAQRVTKALRFGLDEVQPGQDMNNRQRILYEWVDMIAVMDMLSTLGILDVGTMDFNEMIAAKKAKITKYLNYAKSVGAVK
jgi:hypothetical protein